MVRSASMLAAAAVLCTAASARAEVTDDKHHRGFFLRMHLGAGYLNSGTTLNNTDLSIHGGAGSFSIALGGEVSRNLHLFGEAVDSVAASPSVSLGTQSGTANNTTYGLVGIGPGVNYYFMPANAYVSGTLLLARLTLDNGNGSKGNSDWGPAGKFQLGKEWWVSDNWGLGVAGMAMVATNGAGDGSSARFFTWSGAVLFSATYN